MGAPPQLRNRREYPHTKGTPVPLGVYIDPGDEILEGILAIDDFGLMIDD
jgi:hypothetical protein